MIGKPEVRTIWLSAYGWAWTLLLPGLKAIAFVDQKMEKRFRYRLIPLAWMLDDRLGNFSVLRNQNGPGPSTIPNLPTIPTIPTLWLHCASLGEAKGLWALVQSLYESGTGVEFKILVTANTKTGLDYLNECIGSLSAVSIISNAIEARIAPFDHPWVVSQFFQGYRVTALVLYETEIWPHYISVAKSLNIPTLLVSARLAQKAFTRYLRFSKTCAQVFSGLTWIQTQGKADLKRFQSLTTSPCALGFDLKAIHYLVPKSENKNEKKVTNENEGLQKKSRAISQKPYLKPVRLAFISLHKSELDQILSVLPTLMGKYEIVILPRHMRELSAFTQRLLPLGFALWSSRTKRDYLLVDTMGQVEKMLVECQMAFVGGSLIPRGCHNLWEPLNAGLKIGFGPYYENQELLAEILLEKGLAQIIRNPNDLLTWTAPSQDCFEDCDRLSKELSDAMRKTQSECRERIFATFKGGPGIAAAEVVTQLRGTES